MTDPNMDWIDADATPLAERQERIAKARGKRQDLPSLDFVKPVGHDGEHHPVRNPAVQSMTPEDAPAPHSHMDEH
jgi:hypothetical protein